MQRLRVQRTTDTLENLDLQLENFEPPPLGPDDVLIAIHAAGVNRSDISATLGRMPHAVWPRTPGRDWAGVVLEGPSDLIGQEVFGAGGDLGISRDGTHTTHLVLHRDALVVRPNNLAPAEAGALGVPFVTAFQGFRRAGMPKPGDIVLVTAANGMVGQAAVQIATTLGARTFGVTRRAEPFVLNGYAVRMIDASTTDIATVVRDETDGHGADIVYNTVGSPYFAAANQSMAHGGRQILISTIERPVPFDIFTFYRGEHTFVGIDSLALNARACAAILRELLPGFASGSLRPLPIFDSACYPLERAIDAYRAVQSIARNRVVLLP